MTTTFSLGSYGTNSILAWAGIVVVRAERSYHRKDEAD